MDLRQAGGHSEMALECSVVESREPNLGIAPDWKTSNSVTVASLLLLAAFAPGCAMSADSGDEGSRPSLNGAEPSRRSELRFPFPQLPDLVAVTDGATYCSFDANGSFIVRVKNEGNAASAPSVVRIQGGAGTLTRDVGALDAGAVQMITLPFWSFAYCGPDCGFTITVDATDTNAEWSEANTFYGLCVG